MSNQRGNIPVELDFPQEVYYSAKNDQNLTKAKNLGEVICYALRALNWLIGEIRAGNEILVKKPNGEIRQVKFGFLRNLPKL